MLRDFTVIIFKPLVVFPRKTLISHLSVRLDECTFAGESCLDLSIIFGTSFGSFLLLCGFVFQFVFLMNDRGNSVRIGFLYLKGDCMLEVIWLLELSDGVPVAFGVLACLSETPVGSCVIAGGIVIKVERGDLLINVSWKKLFSILFVLLLSLELSIACILVSRGEMRD